MELTRLGIAEKTALSIVEGVASGEYHLLLGAGFSAGAEDGDGKELPSAWSLAKELNDRFGLNADASEFSRLSAIYEDALHSSAGREQVLEFMRRRFTGCKPAWQGDILDFSWSRVWTLNIDDVLDASSDEGKRKWRVRAYSHVDSLRAPDPKSGEIQVIHLHGRAGNIHRTNSDLVFSLPEYSNAMKGRGDWLGEFWSSWLQRPFLAVGAKLLDESDLAGALERGTEALKTTGFPTIAILREFSEREKSRLERKGVLVVKATGKDFFDALASDLSAYFCANPGLATGLTSSQLAAFNAQFELVDTGAARNPRSHDFYAGDEPLWADVLAGRDASFISTDRCSQFLSKQDTASKTILLSGRPGGGKSTAMLRIVRDEIARKRSVAMFRGERKLDVDAVLAWLRVRPKSSLFFDNAADHAESIGTLVDKVRAEALQVNVVMAERASRSRAVVADMGGRAEVEIFEYGLVKKRDVDRIIDVRRTFARLGIGTSWSSAEWDQHFTKRHRGDLFSALSEVEGGAGFYGRMDVEVRRLAASSNIAELKLLLAVAVVHRSGYSLPIRTAKQVLAAMGGVSDDRLIGDHIESLVEFDSKGIRLRHRMLADRLIKQFSSTSERYEVSLSVARSLGVLVTPQSMSVKSYDFLILRALMDQESIRSLLESGSLARGWYGELESLFDWNGRFWDQRALLESTEGAHAPAYSFAKRSVTLHRHPFALTTLGTVRCRAAIDLAPVDVEKAWEYFTEGNAALLESEAIAEGRGLVYEHPFVTFYSSAIELFEYFVRDSARRQELERLRLEWHRLADRKKDAPGIARIVQTKDREWMKKFLKAGLSKS